MGCREEIQNLKERRARLLQIKPEHKLFDVVQEKIKDIDKKIAYFKGFH